MSEMTVLLDGIHFPEGPAFAPDGSLWCVELKGGNLIHVTFESGVGAGSLPVVRSIERIATGGTPNGLLVDRHGDVYFCDAMLMAVRLYRPANGTFRTLADRVDGQPLHKPNDLAFDPAGSLLFTCPGESRNDPHGYVCCLGTDGHVTKVAGGMYFPNGLAFAEDGRTLVIAETFRQRLWRGEWDPVKRKWENAFVWSEVGGPIGPDGVAFGADGLLYTAVNGSGAVKIVNNDGQVEREIPVGGRHPTNCAFDPVPGRFGLLATEAEHGALVSLPRFGPGKRLL